MSRLGDAPDSSAEETDVPSTGEQWSCEEIERLYRRALDAVEAVANDLSAVTQSLSVDPQDEADTEKSTMIALPDLAAPDRDSPLESEREEGGEDRAGLAAASPPTDEESRPDPARVIEAVLFVGGQPLTARSIDDLLGGDFEAGFVERAIDEFNLRYARQNRPYEIRQAEGGYQVVLRPEYEPLRNRVYGFGPKQVRLSQETLEILALVAYRQPIARNKIEEIARRNARSALRQLSERGLLILEHPEGTPLEEACYRTSARFLKLFGIAQLDDLPQIEDLNYK